MLEILGKIILIFIGLMGMMFSGVIVVKTIQARKMLEFAEIVGIVLVTLCMLAMALGLFLVGVSV